MYAKIKSTHLIKGGARVRKRSKSEVENICKIIDKISTFCLPDGRDIKTVP
jgi:hypothetical protein